MLKKLILPIILFTTSVFGFNYDLKPKKISESVWCFLGDLSAPTKENGGFMSNSCYIKTSDSYVLVDSGSNYLFAEQAYKEMSKIQVAFPLPSIYTNGTLIYIVIFLPSAL